MQTQLLAPEPPAMAAFATDDTRWKAVLARDPRAEGQFFYAVITTGVYCRPTCAARPALRANVRFLATAADAEGAGFRPCKRCRPRHLPLALRQRQLVDDARAQLAASEKVMTLPELAAHAGLSPYYFHRLFKKQVGMTPKQYATASRLQRFEAVVREQPTVTAAIYEAGYSSSSRFYEASSRALGVPPSALRRGGQGLEIHALVRRCSLGQMLVAATARGICAIFFGDAPAALERALRQRFPHAEVHPADGALRRLATRVAALVDGATWASDLPLDLLGTAFQQRVWRALRDIPSGTTTTYAALAKAVGAPRAVRAVGTACGANPVAVAIPCHRVVRQDGALGGYRWGLQRKKTLLAREQVPTAPRTDRYKAESKA